MDEREETALSLSALCARLHSSHSPLYSSTPSPLHPLLLHSFTPSLLHSPSPFSSTGACIAQAFNREHEEARKYIFAAETESDMKKWMNVMSLASIAFGSAQASMKKAVRLLSPPSRRR